jgi:PAS domain S-box-containing protein
VRSVLLNSRTTRLLLEAADELGIARSTVLEPLGIEERDVVDARVKVEWTTVVMICDQLSRIFDGDPERLREIGRRMSGAPSYAPLRRLARSLVSVRALYEIANRWVAPANFPHLRLLSQFVSRRRMVLHGEIPASYAPSAAFMRIFEGSVTELPRLLDLPPATMVESRITPRTCDFVVELPRARDVSLVSRFRRATRAVLARREAMAVLEEQRQELTTNVEALQRAREELRALLDRLPDLVVVHSGGTLLWANRAFVQTLGYDRTDELVGSSLLTHVADRSHELVVERMRTAPERATQIVEAHLRSKDGSEVVVEVSPTQNVVFDGVQARLVVGRDVSERARMQQKLVVADRLASIGLLAAGVAHEVNNPLAYVLNNIEIARRELAGLGPDAETSRNVLGVALEGVDRIRTIVRDLLMLSRGEEGPVGPIDARRVAESTLVLAAREIERTAHLVKEFEPVPLVHASDARIAQILLNLVANALEAMRGQPREQNQLTVRIGSAADGRFFLDVTDTGCGIPDRDLPRLFEPFFTTKPAGQGTGLGLPIVHRLVAEMGGEISVTSKVRSGTTFRILLPPVPVTSPPARRSPAEPAGATSR